MFGLAFMAFWLLSSLAGLGFTAWLIRRRWRNRMPTSLAVKLASTATAGSALVGALGTCLGVIQAFGAIDGDSIDPTQKARILGEAIAQAMNWTAFGLIVWFPGTLALLLLTRANKGSSPRE